MFAPLPPALSLPGYAWATTGTRSGMAGRVLMNLLATQNGHLHCGMRAKDFQTIAYRTNPNGFFTYTLLHGYTAFAFQDGSIGLAYQSGSSLTAYPWVLHCKRRLKTKEPGLAKDLDSVVRDLPFISGPFFTDPSSSTLLPWMNITNPCADTPSDMLRATILATLKPLMEHDLLKDFCVWGNNRILMADHPKGCGPASLGWSASNAPTLRGNFPMNAWKDTLTQFVNSADFDLPIATQLGQEHGKHMSDRSNWNVEPMKLFDYKVPSHYSLSAHEEMEGLRIAQTYAIPILGDTL